MKSDRIYKWVFALLIVAFSVAATVLNMGIHKSFVGQDSGVTYASPDTLYVIYHHMWDALTAPGKLNVSASFSYEWANMVFLLLKSGLSSVFVQRLLSILFFAVSGLGTFFLVSLLMRIFSVTKNQKIVYAAAFVGSLLYMFNQCTLRLANIPIIPYHISYMLLPVLLALFIYNLQVRTTFTGIFFFCLTAALASGGNPSNTITIIIFLAGYLLIFWRDIKKSPSKPFRFLFWAFVMSLLMTIHILLPILAAGSDPYGGVGGHGDLKASLTYNSSTTSLTNILMLAGAPAAENFSHYPLYTSIPYLLLGYFIVTCAFAALALKENTKLQLFLALVILLSFFFAKGIQPPFGDLFESIFLLSPVFGIYRSTYLKFIFYAILALSILLSLSYARIFEKVRKGKYVYLLFLIVIPAALLIYNKPFFSYTGYVARSTLVDVPREYYDLEKHAKDVQGTVLSLPAAPYGAGVVLDWPNGDFYVGPHPDSTFLKKSTMDAYWFFAMGYKNLTPDDSRFETRFESNIAHLIELAPILNIDSILLHKDFADKYDFGRGSIVSFQGKQKYEFLQGRMKNHPGLQTTADTDYYTLYKIAAPAYGSIYVPDSIVYDHSQIKRLFSHRFEPGTNVAIASPSVKDAGVSTDQKVRVSYRMILPTRYEVMLSKIDKPVLLAFTQTYHEKWDLSVNGTPLPQDRHVQINGYANGWVIRPSDMKNNELNIIIEFSPQKYFAAGTLVSNSVLAGGSLIVIFLFFKRRNHEK